MILNIGDKAPDFTLPDQQGNEVTLSELKSWVILYFYPKDDTPGCTIEASEFSASLGEFAALGVKVFGINHDDTKSHQKFCDKHDLEVPLLSDVSKDTLKAYGCWNSKSFFGKKIWTTKRVTYLIDPEGNIKYVWDKVKPIGHAANIRDKLEEFL